MVHSSNVCARELLSKDRFQRKLAAAWSRVLSKLDNMSVMAGRMGMDDTSTIKRVTGMKNLPEAHTIFNSLMADETALDEVLAEYGYRLCPLTTNAANDLATLSGLCETAAELSEALRDGIRIHPETLRVADRLRPHMPALNAIIRQADELRGAA